MENKTPINATWIPEAGGYVSNGTVISKSPIYDEKGQLKLDVDTSVFGNVQAKNSPSPNMKVANNPITNNGIATANLAGSNTDNNSLMTSLGSMATLNTNTENPNESVISSPATKSLIAGEPLPSPIDQLNKEYQDAVARDDKMAQINALSSIGKVTGVDYSAEIDKLTRDREEKIKNTDDRYLAEINQAEITGDTDRASQLRLEQAQWRNNVGYQDAMASSQERKLQDNYLRWTDNYIVGINQVTGSIIQLLPSYLNFQYDPTTDAALLRAQSQVQAKMTERYAATGMYYSPASQYAITQATAELVPIYEKMAKEEIKEQLSMLQSTATFLMNLEESQFSLWKGQVELQLKQNAEKRAERDAAIEAANARGYYTNEEAALMGVEPGSLSQRAREHIQELQEQIESEQRALEQKIILMNYDQAQKLALMEEENRIKQQQMAYDYSLKKDYDTFTTNQNIREYEARKVLDNLYDNTNSTSTLKFNGTFDTKKMQEYYDNLVDAGEDEETALYKAAMRGKNEDEVRNFLAANGVVDADSKFAEWGMAKETSPEQVDSTNLYGLTDKEIAQRKKDYPEISELARNSIQSKDVLEKLKTFYADGDTSTEAFKILVDGMNSESSEADDVDMVIYDYIHSVADKELKELAKNYSGSYWGSKDTLEGSFGVVDKYMDYLTELGVDDETRADYAEYMYDKVVDYINGAKDIDVTFGFTNDIVADSKDRAVKKLIERLDNSEDEAIVKARPQIEQYAREKIKEYVAPGSKKTETKSQEQIKKEEESAARFKKAEEQTRIYADKKTQAKIEQIAAKIKNGETITEEERKYMNEQAKKYPKRADDGRVYYNQMYTINQYTGIPTTLSGKPIV